MSSKIHAVRSYRLELSLIEPFGISLSTLESIQNVLVEIELENGIVGIGESAPWPALTGESQSTVLSTIEDLRPHLIGQDALSYRRLSRTMKDNARNQTSARAGLEIALFDAIGQILGISLHQLFGGVLREIESDMTIPIVGPERAAERTRELLDLGYSMIKVKVGDNIEQDLVRLRAIHRVSAHVGLIVDANQGFSASEAIHFVNILTQEGIYPKLLEQPVSRHDLIGLRQVRDRSSVPVAADETVSSRHDALQVVSTGAADYINIKLMKCGGFVEALEIIAICQTGHVKLMIGGMLESRVAMGASAHLAAGTGAFTFIDLDTHLLLASDPFQGGFEQQGPRMILGDSPGHGITIRDRGAWVNA